MVKLEQRVSQAQAPGVNPRLKFMAPRKRLTSSAEVGAFIWVWKGVGSTDGVPKNNDL